MNILFTKNIYDSDGDIVDECIVLHFGNDVMIKVKNITEIQTMIGNLNNIIEEIGETYGAE